MSKPHQPSFADLAGWTRGFCFTNASACPRDHDIEDLFQLCYLRWVKVLDHYGDRVDPEEMSRIYKASCRNMILDLRRRSGRLSRVYSVDDVLESVEVGDLIADENQLVLDLISMLDERRRDPRVTREKLLASVQVGTGDCVRRLLTRLGDEALKRYLLGTT